jgi:hypothetical protein
MNYRVRFRPKHEHATITDDELIDLDIASYNLDLTYNGSFKL